jgi:hypothetical protein
MSENQVSKNKIWRDSIVKRRIFRVRWWWSVERFIQKQQHKSWRQNISHKTIPVTRTRKTHIVRKKIWRRRAIDSLGREFRRFKSWRRLASFVLPVFGISKTRGSCGWALEMLMLGWSVLWSGTNEDEGVNGTKFEHIGRIFKHPEN